MPKLTPVDYDPFDKNKLTPVDYDPFKKKPSAIKGAGGNWGEPDRSFIGDIPAAIGAGAIDTVEQYSRALRALDPKGGIDIAENLGTKGVEFAKSFQKSHPDTFAAPEGTIRKSIYGGARSMIPSVAAGVPGAVVGSVGGPLGTVAGFVGGGGTVFGLAEADRFYEEATNQGIPPDKAFIESVKAGAWEGSLEAANNLLDVILLKMGKPLTSPLKSTLKDIFKPTLKQSVKQFAKTTGKIIPAEVATEVAQEYGGAARRQKLGMETVPPMTAAKEVIGPTVVASILFGLGGSGINVAQRHQVRQSLIDPKKPTGQRIKAVEGVANHLIRQGREDLAQNWVSYAGKAVDEGKAIDLNYDIAVAPAVTPVPTPTPAAPDFVGPQDILPTELPVTQPTPRLIKKPDTTISDYQGARGEVSPFDLATHGLITMTPDEIKADLVSRLAKSGVSPEILEGADIRRPSDINMIKDAINRSMLEGVSPQVAQELHKARRVLIGWQDEQTKNLVTKNKNILIQMKNEIVSGDPGSRIKDYDVQGKGGTPDVLGIPSTYPAYFQNKGIAAKDALSWIDKLMKGERLAEGQQVKMEDLIRDKRAYNLDQAQIHRNRVQREDIRRKIVEAQKPPVSVPAGDLTIGDEFTIKGEKFKVTGEDAEGNVIIKDGKTLVVDAFDQVPIDKGMAGVRKGELPSAPAPQITAGVPVTAPPPVATPTKPRTAAVFEHKEIRPGDKINAITREQAGEMIAAGDPAVVKHIQEGVEINGQAAMQDAIRNQEMIEVSKAHKGAEREAVQAKIREIEPEIDKALKGEKVKEPWEVTQSEYKKTMQEHGSRYQEYDVQTGEETFPKKATGMAGKWWQSQSGKSSKSAGQIILDDTDKYGVMEAEHRAIIQQALSEGKPVPDEVLKDYPELKMGVSTQGSKPNEPTATTEPIQDFGEKIGGARKDISIPLGSRQKAEKPAEEIPSWRKRFIAMEKVKEPGKWIIVDTRTNVTARDGYKERIFQSQEDAESAVPLYAVAHNHSVYQDRDDRNKYSIYRKVGDKKIVKVVNQQFNSRDDAMKYMAEHAEDILSVKTSFGEEILPKPETVQRKGVDRRTVPATAKNFTDTFGFRGVEFGNWNNQDERQEVMDYAYDGLLDLADVLNVPPKALSLNGELAIAFGARGQGLSGGKAHYERDYGIINLTKMSGAGSLAHEWFHALDHYFGRLDTKASSEKIKNKRGDLVYKGTDVTDYLSHGVSTQTALRPEIQEAYKGLISTMYTKAEQYVEDTEKAEKFVSTARNNLKARLDSIRTALVSDLSKTYTYRKNLKGLMPASEKQLAEFDGLADHLVQGNDLKTQHKTVRPKGFPENKPYFGFRITNDTLEAINSTLKAVRNRSGFNAEQTGSLDSVRRDMNLYEARLKMLADAEGHTEKIKNIPTSFAMEAKKIDQGRASDYWITPHEMAARAFAAYVEDNITEKGGQSDFLVFQAHGGVFVPMIDGFVARPYPEGEERVAINKAFDKFVGALKTKETDKGVALYEQPADYNEPAPIFYSQMQRILESKLPNKGPASAFREMIKMWASKGEFKQEEHRWSGVDEWLAEQKGSVSKRDVLEWLKGNLYEGQQLFEKRTGYGKIKAYEDAKKQLDLFKNGQPLSRTRRGLGNRGRGDSGTKTIGVGIRRDLARNGYVDLRGQDADTANKLAEIAQVFRSPQFETFRIFYIKDGKIVGQEGISSRMPGSSSVFLRGNVAKHVFNILNRAQKLKADSYYFLHNHPSGDPKPSPEDLVSTAKVINKLQKMSTMSGVKVPQFKGHVVINSGKYAVMEAHILKHQPDITLDEYDVTSNIYNLTDFKSDELLTAETASKYLLAPINGHKDIVNVGKALKQPDNFVTVIYRGSKGEVRAIEAIPIKQFMSKDAPGILRNRARSYGARDVLTYYDGPATSGYGSKAIELMEKGILLDAIKGESSVLPFRPTPDASKWMGVSGADTAVRVAEEAEKYGKQGLMPKQIIDRLFRLPFKVDAEGRWVRGVAAYNWLTDVITKKKTGNETIDRFAEFVRKGLIDKYGLPENYQQYKHLKMLEQNAISAEGIDYYHEIHKAISDEEQRKTIYRILTENVEPGVWESLTEPVRNAIIRHGEEMVDANMLPRETFERNRGTWLHRSYKKHEAEKPAIQRAIKKIRFIGKELKHRGLKKTVSPNEVEKWVNGDKDGNTWKQMGTVDRSYYEGKTLTKKGSAIIWRDWTKEERLRMGEIEDPAYAIAVSFDLIAKDLSTGKLYKRIADDPLLSADDDPGAWVHFGKEKILNSSTHKWGALADKWVHPEVARDLLLTEKYSMPSTWRWLLTQWKLMKVARNPVVHTNNIVSNFFLQDMHDVGMSEFASGIKSIYDGDTYYDEAKKAGVFGYNLIQSEIKQHYNPAMTKLIYEGDVLKTATEIAKHPIRTIGALDKKFIGLYSKEDDVFRMALYKKMRLQGKSIEESAAEARRQFIDYDISAPWIQWGRNTILPFISYPYRAAPLIAEVALTRPWKLIKYFALFAGIEALSEFLIGVDSDEERKLLPEEQQGRTWVGVHKQVRTPQGFFDISRKLPGADIVGLSEKSAIPLPNMAVPGGPIISGLALVLNRDPFTGKKIRESEIPIPRQAEAVALWTYRQLGPNAPWVPASYSWDKIVNAYKGATDELGRPLDPATAIPSTLGIKISRFDPQLQLLRVQKNVKIDIAEAKRRLWSDKYRASKGEMSKSEFAKRQAEQIGIIKKHETKLKEARATALKLQQNPAYQK